MKTSRVPPATITRLSYYSRRLEELQKAHVKVVSSDRLAELCQVNPAQIRKDLTYFGEFGVRGVGYYVDELLAQLHKILGLDRSWNLALAGIGNLGTALACYENFGRRGFHFVAAFDCDPKKIGQRLPCGLAIEPVDQLIPICRERRVEIGALATPALRAQEVVDRFVQVPVRAILNFAPAQVQAPEGFMVQDVDFSGRLDRLAYHLTSG